MTPSEEAAYIGRCAICGRGVFAAEKRLQSSRYGVVHTNCAGNGVRFLQAMVGEWANETFPESDWRSITLHVREEVDELYEALYPDLDGRGEYEREAGGIVLLMLHLAHKEGFDLFGSAIAEHSRNLERTWESDPGEKGYRKHVETSGAAT